MGKLEPLSKNERLINADGTATSYFIRYLQRSVDAGVSSVSFPVTSVNGQTGDVVLDIQSIVGESGNIDWSQVNAQIQNFITQLNAGINEMRDYTDSSIEAHNADYDSHSRLSVERSNLCVTKKTGNIPAKTIYFPHLHQNGFDEVGLLSYTSPAGGLGIQDAFAAFGAAPGLVGSTRNVYISAFYVGQKRVRVKGVFLPIPGGSGTAGVNTNTDCVLHKCAIFRSRPSQLGGLGRVIKSDFKGRTNNAITVLSSPAAGYALIQLDSTDYSSIGPAVGDVFCTSNTASAYDHNASVITEIDGVNSRITVYNGITPVGMPFNRNNGFFWEQEDSPWACRWLSSMVWSNNGFSDYCALHSSGWTLGCAANQIYNNDEVFYQSQVTGNVSPSGVGVEVSIAADFYLEEGVYFLAILEASLGTPLAASSGKSVVMPKISFEATGNTIGYYGKGNSFCRGLISDHYTNATISTAASSAPLYSLLQPGSSFNRSPINFFGCWGISDSTTIDALDNWGFDLVFPDIPYDASNAGYDSSGTLAFTPAVGSGYSVPASSGKISPIMMPVGFLATFVE